MLEKEYWIIFTQGITHWITRWLKRDFSHIWLLTKDEFNWIAINPTRRYLQFEILPLSIAEDPFKHYDIKAGAILKITFTNRDDKTQFGSVGLLNCVTWSKYVLGLRIWCLTPFGLYRRLLRFKPDDLAKHNIKSIEVHNDWSRNALEQRLERATKD